MSAELRLAGGDRVFDRLTLRIVEADWKVAVDRAGIGHPRPRIHDLATRMSPV